jgi:hypothetical protein
MVRFPLRLFLLLAVVASCLSAAPVPPDLQKALSEYRAEGASHWAFDQKTTAQGMVLVEHFDPSKPEFSRWTLLTKNGVSPSEKDATEYRERLSRRTTGTAPNVKDQLLQDSCELVSQDDVRAVYRFRLRPGSKEDHSAEHMQAQFTLHKATGTFERVELFAFEPFSPMFAVKITEARTVITYSLPEGEKPSLLQNVSLRMRGRVMWFKSLDADMEVVFSNHAYVGRTKPASAENPARSETPSP